MSILVSAFQIHSFLSIPGTIPAPNQEWHHSTRIFVPWNVILAGLWAKIDSSRFRRNDRNLAGISGAWLRPQCRGEPYPSPPPFLFFIQESAAMSPMATWRATTDKRWRSLRTIMNDCQQQQLPKTTMNHDPLTTNDDDQQIIRSSN